MAKLVQKSGYIKSGKASGYMRYIATREGVEKLAGNGAVTKGQRELIQKLLTLLCEAQHNSLYLIMVVMRRTDVKTAPGEDSWRSCFT